MKTLEDFGWKLIVDRSDESVFSRGNDDCSYCTVDFLEINHNSFMAYSYFKTNKFDGTYTLDDLTTCSLKLKEAKAIKKYIKSEWGS